MMKSEKNSTAFPTDKVKQFKESIQARREEGKEGARQDFM